MHFFELEDETVWGATARILAGFLARPHRRSQMPDDEPRRLVPEPADRRRR